MLPQFKIKLQALGFAVTALGPRAYLLTRHGERLFLAASERSAWLAAADEAFLSQEV